MAQLGSSSAPTQPQLGIQNASQTGLKTMLTYNLPESQFFEPFSSEMLVFAAPRGSQNESKGFPRPLDILMFFQLKNKCLQAPILNPLGSLLGFPRRLQEASKASLKQLLEASWRVLAASSIFKPPGGYPQAQI